MAIPASAIDQLSGTEKVVESVRQPRGLTRTLRRVAILGAGTMGARIAAHFANCRGFGIAPQQSQAERTQSECHRDEGHRNSREAKTRRVFRGDTKSARQTRQLSRTI